MVNQTGKPSMLNFPVMQKLVNGQKGNAGTSCAGAWMVKPVTGIIELDLGCFGEFSKAKPFF
jgi:hypothetical protein